MMYINPRLVDDYCSITVANYRLIFLIRFISRIITHLCKKFYKHIFFIPLNDKISFDVTRTKKISWKLKQTGINLINQGIDISAGPVEINLYVPPGLFHIWHLERVLCTGWGGCPQSIFGFIRRDKPFLFQILGLLQRGGDVVGVRGGERE